MLMIANDTLFNRQTREWYKKSYDNLQKNIGEYILLTNKPVTIDAINIKSKAPLHIAILTDNSTGSSAEQFVLDAKQSSKVKIYGKPTLGSLDISNMNSTKSPSGEFILRYGTSKSLRIPEYQVDDIGLMPDVYLDSTIPDYFWVEFAKSKLEKL
jgi:C-terminal processing protease CtpA/Prc